MMRSCRCYCCLNFKLGVRDEFQTFLRDYDRLQYIAFILIYIQIGCALIGSLGALYNGVLLINLAIALFALVAIESSSQSLGRTYAVLIPRDFARYFLIIGLSVRLSSSFLWIQIYRLGVSYIDSLAPTEADFDLSNSFLSPVTPAAAVRKCSGFDDALGGARHDPTYYSSLFEDGQDNKFSLAGISDVIGDDGSTSGAKISQIKASTSRSFQNIDFDYLQEENPTGKPEAV